MNKINFKNEKNPYYFVILLSSLIPPTLILGPFIPDLIISGLSIWFLFYCYKNKIFFIFKNKFFLYFLIFWISCIISSIFSENITYSLKASVPYIRIAIFALLISYIIHQNEKILTFFYYSIIFSFSLLIIDGYVQYIFGKNLLGFLSAGGRNSSLFGDEYILGSYLTRILPLCIALFLVNKNKKKIDNIFFPFFLILTSGLIFIAGERASFFFMLISYLFMLFFMSKYKIFRIIIFTLSIILSVLILTNDKNLYKRYVESPIKSIGIDKSKKNFFTPEHDSLFRTAWNMFRDRPLIGHGPKMFRIKCSDPNYSVGISPCHTHPHNFYLQLLAETGLLGFAFLSLFFIYFCYLVFKHLIFHIIKKKPYFSDYHICLLAGLLITIWPITTNGNLFTNNLMIFYGLQMGFFSIRFK
jgi:O-antigen ligase